MPAATPTLDRFTADACRIAAEHQDELVSEGSEDEVAELAFKAADLAIPRIECVTNSYDQPETVETIVEAFVELARIVMTGDLTEVRTIMAASAIQVSRTDFQLSHLLMNEAARDRDLDAFLRNAQGGFEAFRASATFFVVNTPGGALDAAFDLVMGLTDEELS
jgi:hypothetical protein